jgi:hypothetical protein
MEEETDDEEEVASSSTDARQIKKEKMLQDADDSKLLETMQSGIATMTSGFQKAKKALQQYDNYPEGSVMGITIREMAGTAMAVQNLMQAGEYGVTWNRWQDGTAFDKQSMMKWCDSATLHMSKLQDLLKCIKTLQPKTVN